MATLSCLENGTSTKAKWRGKAKHFAGAAFCIIVLTLGSQMISISSVSRNLVGNSPHSRRQYPPTGKLLPANETDSFYFDVVRGEQFTYSSPPRSEKGKNGEESDPYAEENGDGDAPYAMCISGSRFDAITTERMMAHLDKYVLEIIDKNKCLADEQSTPEQPCQNTTTSGRTRKSKVDIFIHSLYYHDPEPVISFLNRYRPYLRGFVVRRYDSDFVEDLSRDGSVMLRQETTTQESLYRGVQLCHLLLRQHEDMRLKRYKTVLRARPDIYYKNPVNFARYTVTDSLNSSADRKNVSAIFFPRSSNCCSASLPVVAIDPSGIQHWAFGAIGYNDQAAIGSSYAMELYSNLASVYVSLRRYISGMSEQLLYYYVRSDLQVETYAADFTYELERAG